MLFRWRLFFKHLEKAIYTATNFDPEAFKKEFLQEIGRPFSNSTKLYPTKPTGNTLRVSKFLYDKWNDIMKDTQAYGIK